MNTMIAIAMLALSLFGPGWSSEHKAFWEWQLGHKLEGYEEHRLSRGWRPDGGGPLLGEGGSGQDETVISPIPPSNPPMICRQAVCTIGGGCTCVSGWEPVPLP